jgi:hypothetical protein
MPQLGCGRLLEIVELAIELWNCRIRGVEANVTS